MAAAPKSLALQKKIEDTPIVSLESTLLQRYSPELKEVVKEELLRKLRGYVWGHYGKENNELATMLKVQNSSDLIDSDILSAVIRRVNINLANKTVLAMLRIILHPKQYSLDRDKTGNLRRSVVSWLGRIVPSPTSNFLQSASSLQTFTERLRLSLSYFTDQIRGNEEYSLEDTFQWCIQVFLESILLDRGTKNALQCINDIGKLTDKYHKLIVATYAGVIRAVALTFRPSALIDILFPDQRYMALSQHARMNSFHRCIVREMMYDMVIELNESSSRGEESPSFLQLFHSDASRLEIMHFHKHDSAWFHFFAYFSLQNEFLDHNEDKYKKAMNEYRKLSKEQPKDDKGNLIKLIEPKLEQEIDPQIWRTFNGFAKMIETIFRTTIASVYEDTCRIEFLASSVNHNSPYYEQCWTCIDEHKTYQEIIDKYQQSEKLRETLEQVKTVCETLFPTGQLIDSVKKFTLNFNAFNLSQVRVYLGMEDNKEIAIYLQNFQTPPLSPVLLSALQWLHVMCKSQLFLDTFISCDETGIDAIIPASVKYTKYFTSIIEKSITFQTLSEISSILVKSKERAALVFGGTGFSLGTQSPEPTWTANTDFDKELVKSIGTSIKEFIHLETIYRKMPSIKRVLNTLPIFLSDSGRKGLDSVKASADNLSVRFNQRAFNQETLKDYPPYHDDAANIHPCLLALNAELFEEIPKAMDLLDWLRSLPNDNDFTSSVELAMGKSEMECPPSLWEEEPGKPGRVSEEKLSMVSTVRGYLHSLIYRTQIYFDNFVDLIHILNELRPADDNVISSLRISQEHVAGLMELLDDNKGQAAPDRLLALHQEQKKAMWRCSNVVDIDLTEGNHDNETLDTVGEVWLEWIVFRKGADEKKRQNISELMDFQSTVVLSSTDTRQDKYQDAIDNFIQQFGWMKHLWTSLSQLHTVGHFDYRTFTYEFPISTDSNEIRIVATKAAELLDQWTNRIQLERSRYYFLNFFGMRHLWTLLSVLDNEKALSDDHKELELRGILSCVNLDAASDPVELCEFIERITEAWNKSAKSKSSRSAVETLELCAQVLETALTPIPTRYRPATLDILESTTTTFSGLHVICAETPGHVYDHILSAYASIGYLPEHGETYVCHKHTTWEDLNTFAFRWSGAHKHNRSDRLYCLASVELLSFELQRKMVSAIRDGLSVAQNPLLIISGKTENQHIVTQFSHCRSNAVALPADVLRKFSQILSDDYSSGISVYTGHHAGCGKTFKVRYNAAATMSEYFHFPVLSCNNLLSEFLKNEEMAFSNDYQTIHFDIADCIREEFSSILFNLTFLGGIYDTHNGVQYFWDPSKTALAFEMPTVVYHNLQLAKLLPQTLCVVNENTFRSKFDDLQAGMGEEFSSSRYDGTALRKPLEGEKIKIANAYDRLRYISLALQILETNNGRFPYIDESVGSLDQSLLLGTRDSGMVLVDPNKKDITSDTVFRLTAKVAQLNEANPSLWCLWNFINIFYWQLRDMHHPESPINCACMPDKYSERDDDEDGKAKIKGEVIQFLIRTAREFATRQQHKEDPDRIAACKVSGMSRWEFNGIWNRMEYDNDGEPCFRKQAGSGILYIYYRANLTQWVIDDIMEPTGATFASNRSSEISESWFSSPDWKIDTSIRIRDVRDVKGYNGKAIEVSGVRSKIKGETENGTYLLQPPYDNIAGHAHYIMDRGAYRRHLFWSEIEQLWQICPVCNNEEGAFALSCTNNMQQQWKCIPDDIKEAKANIEMISLSQWKVITGQKPSPVSKEQQQQPKKLELSNEYVEIETMEEIWDNTVKWNDSNHECLLFSNEVHVVRFLSLDPKKMRDRMHPGLLNHLQQNRINVGEDLDSLNGAFHEILSSLTEVKRSEADGKSLLDGKYCLTGDSLLKMLAIFARLRCGVPVVLMGECGCGKTMLITYLCAWMGVKLLVLDVHGGTSEDDILDVFDKAADIIAEGKMDNVFVFLDEINTCSHMALMNEAICHRSLRGKRIPESIHILAALNPYRKRPEREALPGLVYQLHGNAGPLVDPMAKLVYRVHPIPHTLRDFIFDFGSLTPEKEMVYIFSMVSTKFPQETEPIRRLVSELIAASQEYIRAIEQEASSASLRDVRRCLNLIEFFSTKINKKRKPGKKAPSISPFACSVVLGLAFVYYYRLGGASERQGYWDAIGTYSDIVVWGSRKIKGEGFDGLKKEGAFAKLLAGVQQNFCNNVKVEDGIAMNQALMENLFVVLICILNKIPVFLVGKPGSSKTLTMQVIASNLQGKQSEIAFWRQFPAVYIFQYQCSPMSDSHSIQHQFDMAVRYQQHAENTITVLLLDEVGLAEHSPDMPLKVLHGMLVDPPVSVVGLSNWVLDPAKMNRAICLQRTEPSQTDIQLTGQRILSTSPGEGADNKVIVRNLSPFLSPLAQAYHAIYTKQKGRDFVGMRDYYNLIKLLRTQLSRSEKLRIDNHLLTFSLCRNFGGKPELMSSILKTFHSQCFKSKFDKKTHPKVQQLISANLDDPSARHLMVLTKNGAALPLLFGTKLLDELQTTVLIGSEFADDRTELHLVTQINQVKLAMASGSTVVLLNHDNIYEALYDVLNQRYLYKSDSRTGKTLKLLRLAIGSRSQLCSVGDGFKIVVVVEQDHAYRDLDLPLLNRFEKQVLCPEDVLTETQTEICKSAYKWIESIMNETGLKSVQEVFCGFHRGTVPSAVLNIIDYGRCTKSNEEIEADLKHLFCLLALPIAMITSKTLRDTHAKYFRNHSNFTSIVQHYIAIRPQDSCSLLLTYSPSAHFDDVLIEVKDNTNALISPEKTEISHLQLGEVTSERIMKNHFSSFYSSITDKPCSLLVVQCDPLTSSQTLIDHARHICTQEYFIYQNNEKLNPTLASRTRKHIIFLVHLPPGLKQRQRKFSLDFQSHWQALFVDDLRAGTAGNELDTIDMLQTSAYDLVTSNRISLSSVINSRFQYALSCCTVPSIQDVIAYYSERIRIYRVLLAEKEFFEFIEGLIVKILEYHREPIQGANNLHKHVQMASSDLAGSLRQSLELALHTMVLQSLAHCILTLDTNFNIRNALTPEGTLSPLWMHLARSKLCFNPETFVAQADLGDPPFSVPIHEIPNTGRHGPIMSQFPFSHKLCEILNENQLQSKVREVEGGKTLQEKLHQTCLSILGDDMMEKLDSYEEIHGKYLHDFISLETSPIPGLSVHRKQQIYEIVLITANPIALRSIAGVQATIWENESRLFAYCSLLSCSVIPSAVRVEIIESLLLQSTARSEQTPEGLEAIQERLVELDYCLIRKIFDSMWDRFADQALNEVTLQLWTQEISATNSDITFLLSTSPASPRYDSLVQSYLGLQLASIFLQEIAQPFITQKELPNKSIQFRKVAQNCMVHSFSYLKSLVATIMYGLDSNDIESSQRAGNFVRRYVQEIVFGEQEGFLRISKQTSIDDELVKAFEWIINASKETTIDPSVHVLPQHAIDTPLRRVLVHCLVRAIESGVINSTIQLTTTIGRQIYLQYWEDKLAEQSSSGYVTFTDNDVQLAKLPSTHPETPVEWSKYLESIARCRFMIQSYTKSLISMDVKSDPQKVLDSMNPHLASLLFTDHELSGLLAVKHLRNRGGMDSVIDLMELPENIAPWIRCNHEVLANDCVSLVDPFAIVFDKHQYEALCKDIRLVTTSDHSIPSAKYEANQFISALFSQVFMNSEHLNINKTKETLSKWLSTTQYSEKSLKIADWLCNISSGSLPSVFDRSSSRDMLLIQIMVHLAINALSMPESWLASLLWHPERVGILYFPFITTNAFAEAIAASGSVGWYLCPKGHPYSVGGCHLPMEMSVCLHPGCGAQIGGRNHVSVRGVRKLGTKELDDLTKPGYSLEDAMNSSSSRGSICDSALTRLFVHCTLALSSMITTEKTKTKSALESLRMKSLNDMTSYMVGQARVNISTLQQFLAIGESDVGLVAHLVLRKINQDKVCKETPYIPSLTSMRDIERRLKLTIEQTTTGIRRKLHSLGEELQQGSRIASARAALGENWDLIHETDSQPSPSLDILLWRYREPVTFEHFTRVFTARSGTQKRFPLLSAFLKEESRLHMIKYTADVLAWHQILFEIFPPSSITREQAMNITNAQAIEENLPRDRQIYAFRVLHAFCVAFNECLPLVERIFECEPNPFISGPNGVVDLSGARQTSGGTLMSEDCSINFSLPSMVRGANDAMGLCTVKLLELMQNAQGEVLNSFANRSASALLKNEKRGACDIPVPVDIPNDIEVPSMSYMTDSKILNQQLIVYDRKEDFMPLLQIFASQSLEYAQGMYLDYDFEKIEAALANSLVGGKMPVKLQIRHFQYHGDVKNAGHLSELHLRVPQKLLTPSVLESIWNEIDTRDRLMKLMRHVEMCISFISSVGSSSQTEINGHTFLHQYVLNTLLIDRMIWEEITTQTITQHIQLCHLQSFYMELEEKMYGSPLEKVEECYREFMDEQLTKEVRDNAKHFDFTCLIPVLRQFLVQQLCEAKWEVDAPLKEYLTFVSASVDLEDLDWFNDYFPSSLQLKHTYQFYYHILGMI